MAKRKNNYEVAIDGSQDFAVPRRKFKSHSWWKCLIAFFVGQITLILVLVLGVSIAATKVTTGKVVELAMGGEEKAQGILSEAYSSKSLFELGLSFVNEETKIETIGDIVEISPKVDQILDENVFSKTSDFGINIDKTVFYAKPFDQIGDYVTDLVQTIELATVLEKVADMDVSTGIFSKILLNDDGSAKTIADFTGDGGFDFDSIISSLTMADIDPDGTLILNSLPVPEDTKLDGLMDAVFGLQLKDILGEADDGMMKVVGEKTIQDLKDNPDQIAEGIKISDVMPDAASSGGVLGLLADCYVCAPVPTDAQGQPLGLTIEQKLDVVTIGEIIGGTPSGIMTAIWDSTLDTIADDVQHVKIKDAIGGDKPDGVIGFLWDTEVGDLTNKIDELTIGTAIGGSKPADGVMAFLWDSTLNDVSTKIDDLTIGDAVGGSKPDGVLGFLWETKVGNLETKIGDLTIGTAVGGDKNDQPKALQALWDAKVTEMGDTLDTLTLQEFIDIDPNNNILKGIAGSKLSEMSAAIDNLTFYQVFGDDIFETRAKPTDPLVFKEDKKVWKFMLCTNFNDPSTNKAEVYKVTKNMNDLVTNMTNNMGVARLYDLRDAGLIDVEESALNAPFRVPSPVEPFYIQINEHLGNCTISQVVSSLGGAI